MADMLALDADYRMRFGARELRPMVARALFPVGLTAACALVAFILAATLPA